MRRALRSLPIKLTLGALIAACEGGASSDQTATSDDGAGGVLEAYCPGVPRHAPDAKVCRVSADCDPGERCQPSEPGSELGLSSVPFGGSAGFTTGGAAQVPVCPDLPPPCASDTDCLEGQACDRRPDEPGCSRPVEPRCYARCYEGECGASTGSYGQGAFPETCSLADGHCVPVGCDEPGGQSCPDAYECAPDPERAEEDGCFPLSCAEDYECPVHDSCAADRIPRYAPGAALHDGRPVDPHLCVRDRCDEGHACNRQLVGNEIFPERCDPDSSDADAYGCAPPRCDQGAFCGNDDRCDPDSAEADVNGCVPVPCRYGETCSADSYCDAQSSGADEQGCVPRPLPPAPLPPSCLIDSSCECGACVLGRCEPRPGLCVPEEGEQP